MELKMVDTVNNLSPLYNGLQIIYFIFKDISCCKIPDKQNWLRFDDSNCSNISQNEAIVIIIKIFLYLS